MATTTNATTATATATNKAKRTTRKRATSAKAFKLDAWKAELIEASKQEASAATRVLELVKAARGKIDESVAREAIKEAFGPAGANWKDKTLQKRVSDAMAIFKAAKLPKEMPANLQRAADATRKLNPGKPRKPRTPSGEKASDAPSQAVNVDSLRENLANQLNGIKKQTEDESVLSLIADLLDVLNEG